MFRDFQLESVISIQDLYLVPLKNQMLVCRYKSLNYEPVFPDSAVLNFFALVPLC